MSAQQPVYTGHQLSSGEQKVREFNDVLIEVISARDLPLTGGCCGMTGSRPSIKDVKGLRGDSRHGPIVQGADPQYEFSSRYQFNFKLSGFKIRLTGQSMLGEQSLGDCIIPIDQFYGQLPVGQPFVLDLPECPLMGKHRSRRPGTVHLRITTTFWWGAGLEGGLIIAAGSRWSCRAASFRSRRCSSSGSPGTLKSTPGASPADLAERRGSPVDLDGSVVALDANLNQLAVLNYRTLADKAHNLIYPELVQHSGDDTTGDGDGDDETITFRLDRLAEQHSQIDKFAIVINCYTLQPIASVKFAYFRLIVNGQTQAFYGLSKSKIPDQYCTGLLMGVVERHSTAGWVFRTEVVAAPGREVQDSMPMVVAHLSKRQAAEAAQAMESEMNMETEEPLPVG